MKKHEPPQDIDAERALLGCIMKDQSKMDDVVEVLKVRDDFYHPKHKSIYQSMLNLFDRQEPIDCVTISNEVKVLDGKYDLAYLVDMVEEVASTAHVMQYASAISNTSTSRKLIAICDKTIEGCYDQKQPISTITDTIEQDLFDMTMKQDSSGPVLLSSLLPDNLQEMDDYTTGAINERRLATGFYKLDRNCLGGGFTKGRVYIISGESGLGKTQLAVQMAQNVAKNGNPVLFISLEMQAGDLSWRVLCHESNVDSAMIQAGKMTSDDFDSVMRASQRLDKVPLYIDDSTGVTPMTLLSTARKSVNKFGIKLLMVDYTQLIESSKAYGNRQEEMTSVSRSMTEIAKALDIPVVSLSQLNDNGQIRESRAIFHDASVEMRVEHDITEDAQGRRVFKESWIKILKNRQGVVGAMPILFEHGRFKNLETHHVEGEI